MINVSKEFQQMLYEDKRQYLDFVDITLRDGTELNLKNRDIWQGGIAIEDAVSSNTSFDIGAAIINKCDITVENLDDRFSEYDFDGAGATVSIGLALPDETVEKVQKGVYTVKEAQYNGSMITLTCYDNMSRFDRSYSESKLSYPATLKEIVQDACSSCGVVLATQEFPHDDFTVPEKPSEDITTFREVVSWAAQIACCFARCNAQGNLEIKWYDQQSLEIPFYDGGVFAPWIKGNVLDGGHFRPWDSGDSVDGGTFGDRDNLHHIYSHYSSPKISTDDVVITGVRVSEKNNGENSNKEPITTFFVGQEGYVVSIENNDLIQGGAGEAVAGWIGEKIIGLRFRKAEMNHASDPSIEAGDVALLTDRKFRTYPVLISYTKFTTNGSQTSISSASDPAKNSAARFSVITKNYVENRKAIERDTENIENGIKDLNNKLDDSTSSIENRMDSMDNQISQNMNEFSYYVPRSMLTGKDINSEERIPNSAFVHGLSERIKTNETSLNQLIKNKISHSSVFVNASIPKPYLKITIPTTNYYGNDKGWIILAGTNNNSLIFEFGIWYHSSTAGYSIQNAVSLGPADSKILSSITFQDNVGVSSVAVNLYSFWSVISADGTALEVTDTTF